MFEFSSVISLSSFIRPFPAGIGRLWLKNLTPSILHFLIFKIWIMSPTLQMQAFQGHQAEDEHVLGSNNVFKMLAVVSVQDDCLGLLSLPQNSPGSPNFLQSQPYWNVPISVIPKEAQKSPSEGRKVIGDINSYLSPLLSGERLHLSPSLFNCRQKGL